MCTEYDPDVASIYYWDPLCASGVDFDPTDYGFPDAKGEPPEKRRKTTVEDTKVEEVENTVVENTWDEEALLAMII